MAAERHRFTGRAYRSSAPEAVPPPKNLPAVRRRNIIQFLSLRAHFDHGALAPQRTSSWLLLCRTLTMSSGSVTSALLAEDGMCGHVRARLRLERNL